MSNMAGRRTKQLNLEKALPEGLLADATWLKQHGYSRQLWNHYVATGWLTQPAPRVFRRPRGSLSWQQAVISLQNLLECPLVVGGRTALELQGLAHYLSHEIKHVHVYGPKPPPAWLRKLGLKVRFEYHRDRRLFRQHLVAPEFDKLIHAKDSKRALDGSLTTVPSGHWDWPLIVSSSERAILEMLDEVPRRETFHQADMLMQGMINLSPRRLQKLLADCKSVKVKRLFFFADRHRHAWLKHLNKANYDLGKGKRMLVRGGKLDPVYQITVPEDLNGVP
jgi:hypothetical protein